VKKFIDNHYKLVLVRLIQYGDNVDYRGIDWIFMKGFDFYYKIVQILSILQIHFIID
jgi:hypothetical protein